MENVGPVMSESAANKAISAQQVLQEVMSQQGTVSSLARVQLTADWLKYY